MIKMEAITNNNHTNPRIELAFSDTVVRFVSGAIDERDDFDLIKNIDTLNSFLNLRENWDEYGAEPFDYNYIQKAIGLLKKMKLQPEVFPTGRKTILCEYDQPNGKHLSFEYIDDNSISLLIANKNQKPIMKTVDSFELLNEISRFMV